MLAKRIIPCLDVKNNKVVKGTKYLNHKLVGDILEIAQIYSLSGADELVFYDITASCDKRTVSPNWVSHVASLINIPFCVAGGIQSLKEAEAILFAGADKISINSPALNRPSLINDLVQAFGQQCIVIGIDSLFINNQNVVCQYTGDPNKSRHTFRTTHEWVREVQDRGAGEIVLNCMNQDGMKNGYDIEQLSMIREISQIPLIASSGAGDLKHFLDVFKFANVDGALAASVFHSNKIKIPDLKNYLKSNNIEVRL